MNNFPAALNPSPEDIKNLLACKTHIGDQNCNPKLARYIWKKRSVDGVHIINLAKTWEKLMFAARVIVAIENPQDICVVSGVEHGRRAALKFARFIGANAVSGRFTPGTFTNQIQKSFVEPRLLIVADPREDSQAVQEAAYVNLPVIAFCNTNSPINNVDIVIPANTNTTESLGLLFWLLSREVKYLKGELPRKQPWDVMIDLFFWTESKKQQQQKQRTGRPERGPRGAGADHRGDQNALEPVETPWLPSKPESGQNWDAPAEWAADVPAEASGAGGNWDQAGAQ
jgi:small subunit ribosomal protein SAe